MEEAAEFLQEALADGPQPSKNIQQQAAASGITHATLRRAQTRLGVVKRPGGFGESWMLELRRVAQDSAELLNGQT